MNEEKRKALELIKECLIDYANPLHIIGNIEETGIPLDNMVSVVNTKANFAILNNNYPEWLDKAYNKVNTGNNVVVFKDFNRLSDEEQHMFIDIVCYNKISSEDLPDDLKIVLNSDKQCKLIPKIREVVEEIRL